jgi:hypothetical protein
MVDGQYQCRIEANRRASSWHTGTNLVRLQPHKAENRGFWQAGEGGNRKGGRTVPTVTSGARWHGGGSKEGDAVFYLPGMGEREPCGEEARDFDFSGARNKLLPERCSLSVWPAEERLR